MLREGRFVEEEAQQLGELRQELKEWERDFLWRHGRKPTKADVDGAPQNMRYKYHCYRELKKMAQSQSHLKEMERDPIALDGVFGTSFNKPEGVSQDSQPDIQEGYETVMMKRVKRWAMESFHMTGSKNVKERKGNGLALKNNMESSTKSFPDLLVQDSVAASDAMELVNVPQELLPYKDSLTPAFFHSSCCGLSGMPRMNRKRKFNLERSWLDQCDPEKDRQHIQQLNVESDNKKETINLGEMSSFVIDSTSCSIVQPSTEMGIVSGGEESSSLSVGSGIGNCASLMDCKVSLPLFPSNDVNESAIALLSGSRRDNEQQTHCKEAEQSIPTTNTAVSQQHGTCEQRKQQRRLPIHDNGNYVRLNLKRQFYKRRGHGKSSASIRRQQWRSKLRKKLERDPSNDQCFVCNEEGHWANHCPNRSSRRDIAIGDEMEKTGVDITDQDKSLLCAASQDLRFPDVLPLTFDHCDSRLPIPLPTVYKVLDSGCLPDTPPEVLDALFKLGFTNFRPGQEVAVMRVLCGLSSLVVLPTGSGKSLCYQLPAYLYARHCHCITLVISPLVSLMEDQVHRLPTGLRGACLHSGMPSKQRQTVLSQLNEKRVDVLLLSPEAVISGYVGGDMFMKRLPPVAFACIDEVHCISEWSHNFRPSYLQLCKVLKQQYHVQCLLGLTATAAGDTILSLSRHLDIDSQSSAVMYRGGIPDNLELSVSCDSDKEKALISLLTESCFRYFSPIIVYCTRQQETERVAQLIRTCLQGNQLPGNRKERNGDVSQPPVWSAEAYHARVSPSRRHSIQKQFENGKLRVVVATVAFGMGIDKSDVRGIIHYNLPKSIENYIQEIGRAGRDGCPAHCHAFIDSEGSDLSELKRHIYSSAVDRCSIKQLISMAFPVCQCKDAVVNHDVAGMPRESSSHISLKRSCAGHEMSLITEQTVLSLDLTEEMLLTLLCYLELHQSQALYCLPQSYSTCSIACYRGAKQLNQLISKVPAVAAAVSLCREKGKDVGTASSVKFNIIEMCRRMGWDSAIVKRELQGLRWADAAGGPRKTGVVVEFSDISFRFHSAGDLSDFERDALCDYLTEKVQNQLNRSLLRLKTLHDYLMRVAQTKWNDLTEKESSDLGSKLKQDIDHYLMQDCSSSCVLASVDSLSDSMSAQVKQDIRMFLSIHNNHNFTGQSIARIFQGIPSPCYPANIWGRTKYWRRYIDLDFNALVKFATQELLHCL